jgi:transposase
VLVAQRNAVDQLRSERARHAREGLWALEWANRTQFQQFVEAPRTPREMWPLVIGLRHRLTGEQWAAVEDLFDAKSEGSRGRPRRHRRSALDMVIAILRHGGWQGLPRQNLASASARSHFRDWCRSGVLREALNRLEAHLCRSQRPDS